MRIDNDTTSYSGDQFTHSHHHHITKCAFEEHETRRHAGAAGMQKDTYQAGAVKAVQEEINAIGIGQGTGQKNGRFKIGKGFVKGLWDAMGDDEHTAEKNVVSLYSKKTDSQDRGFHGISAAISGYKQEFSHYIVNKWERVREKIKTGIHTALKRFGRDKDSFAMLSDAGHQTDGNKGPKDWEKAKQKGTRTSREEIPEVYPADNHLMDSYSKTGEYCRLNENLTYQRK